LSESEYMNLGIKRSVFDTDERKGIYQLFVKYLEYLKESPYFDTNIEAFQRIEAVNQSYDYVVVDEVQDLTNVQLYLILKSLKKETQFILCGDSNQMSA
jgi:superfamily I DNA/RNA helicase